MKPRRSTRSKAIIKMVQFCSLLFLFGVLISCNRNSPENGDSGKTELKEETYLTGRDSSYIVDVTAIDYAFGMPTEIPSGWITFRMKNMGQEEHLGLIAKYPDSLGFKSLAEMMNEAFQTGKMEDFSPILELRETQYGGPAMLSPGLTGETTVFLEPGLYALTCWVKAPDGEYHLQKGMTRPFQIINEKTGAAKPEGTVKITVSDFAIDIEDPVGAGEHVFIVHFEDMHNVHMARLEHDQKLEDLQEWMNNIKAPSPFKFIGGTEQAPVGMTTTFRATLAPGRYAFVTYGRAIYGMAEEITVPETGMAPIKAKEALNEEIVIESDLDNTKLPEKIPTGRTPIVVKNTGSEPYAYNLLMLKKGKSVEDVEKYFKAAYIQETTNPSLASAPFHPIWNKALEPGEEDRFNLELAERKYVFFGPITLEGTWEFAWREENMFHTTEGVKKDNELEVYGERN